MADLLKMLKDILSGHIEHALLAVICASAAYLLFRHFDALLSTDARANIGRTLKRLDLQRALGAAPGIFLTGVDRIFGRKLFSWRAFFVSAFISIYLFAAITAFLFVHFGLDPDVYLRNVSMDISSFKETSHRFTATNIAVALMISVTNICVDFFSLVITRAILQKIRRGARVSRLLMVLCLDLVASYIVFVVPAAIIASMWMPEDLLRPVQWSKFPFVTQIPHASINIIGYYDIIADWYNLCVLSSLFTSLLTSIWLWLFMIAVVIAWLGRKVVRAWRFAQWALDVETQPLRAMAPFAALAGFLLYYATTYGWQGLMALIDASTTAGIRAYALKDVHPEYAVLLSESSGGYFTTVALAALFAMMLSLSTVLWVLASSKTGSVRRTFARVIALATTSSFLGMIWFYCGLLISEAVESPNWAAFVDSVENEFAKIDEIGVINGIVLGGFVGVVATTAATRAMGREALYSTIALSLGAAFAVFDTLCLWYGVLPGFGYAGTLLRDAAAAAVIAWPVSHLSAKLGLSQLIIGHRQKRTRP